MLLLHVKQASLSQHLTTQNRKDHFGSHFAKKKLLEVSVLLAVTHCPKMQCWVISGKTNDGTLKKWQ